MKQDVAKYIPFESFNFFDIVYINFNKHDCDIKEVEMIWNLNTNENMDIISWLAILHWITNIDSLKLKK
jgi:hypothetical protein